MRCSNINNPIMIYFQLPLLVCNVVLHEKDLHQKIRVIESWLICVGCVLSPCPRDCFTDNITDTCPTGITDCVCELWGFDNLEFIIYMYVYIFISGGPLSALTCCVNVRLLSGDKKNIAVNLFSKLGWELGLYYASYDDFHPDILARMYT